ncbi:MAG: hypothetical protein ACK55V_14840, partial [Alphaproteobacteria bacterium]
VTPKQESRPSQLKKENQDSSKSLAITNTTLTPPSFPFPVNNNVKSQPPDEAVSERTNAREAA